MTQLKESERYKIEWSCPYQDARHRHRYKMGDFSEISLEVFDIKVCLCCSDLKLRKKKRRDTSHLPHPVTQKVQAIQNHLLIHHRILRVLQKRNLKNEKRNTKEIPRNIRKKRRRERKARKGQF